VQVLVNLIDFGMNLQEAGDAPRIDHEGSSEPTGEPLQEQGGTVALEGGFAPEVLEALRARGHVLVERRGVFGGYQAVARDPETGVYTGASDARKDGQAAGY
jgi:gamma-glutamyltranspeptidase/glutathione hydrolase